MKEYIEQLKEKLEKQLSIHQEEKQPLRRLRLCKEATQEAIVELTLLTPDNGLTDPEEVVLYHTQWAPYFYGKLHYFNKCFDLELICLSKDEEEKKRLYEHQLQAIQYFFHRYSGFCQAYYSGECDHDPALYWCNAFIDSYDLEEPALVEASAKNHGRKLVALILANEQYRDYLINKLLGSGLNSPADAPPSASLPQVKWVKPQNYLAELIVSLFVNKSIEIGGKVATLRDLEKFCKILFGISFADLSVTDYKNRNRKKATTVYLDELKRGMLDRGDELTDRYP